MLPLTKTNMKLTYSTILVKKQELLETAIDDETVLLSIFNEKYYGMNAIASRIWSLLDSNISIQTIIAILHCEFEVSTIECENDVMEFLENLIKEGLIVTPSHR